MANGVEMRKDFFFALQLYFFSVLIVWHVFGHAGGLYEQFFWWDIVSHTLGGLWVGCGFAWTAEHFKIRPTATACVAAAFVGGLLWEVYEYESQTGPIFTRFMIYDADTIKDIVDDVIGGLVAGYIVVRIGRTSS